MRPPKSTRRNKSGVIVLDADGQLLFANGRARTLLTFHFPSCNWMGNWPQRLGIWIAQATPLSNHARGSISEVLVMERDERRLLVRMIETRLETILLLDEKRISTAAPNKGMETLLTLGMTERECEVLFWVAEGKSNPAIALILGIALRTVKKHLEHIFEKLGVENRTCAAARASDVLHTNPPSRIPRVSRRKRVAIVAKKDC